MANDEGISTELGANVLHHAPRSLACLGDGCQDLLDMLIDDEVLLDGLIVH